MARAAEWTILVFLNAKNNLEEFAFPNFEQMASIGSTAEVNVVVEMGRPRQHHYQGYGAWSKTLRFQVAKGMQPVESSALHDLGAVNMGDGRALADFVRWGRIAFPARRTMLVIWNHGQGWRVPTATRIAGDQRTVDRYVAMRSGLRGVSSLEVAGTAVLADDLQVNGGVRYVSNDDDTGDKLYNSEIQRVLSELLADERLDVIAFDACLMAMVETAYALRGVARVMVGSEELEPGTGWNYTRWLQPLVDARGQVDAEGLGRLMVKGMEDEYGDLDQTTLSSTDLSKIPELAAAISGFAEAALPLLTPANLPAFRAARGACANYAPGYGLHSIDLGRYMEQVGSGPLAGLHGPASDVLTQLHAAVQSAYASRSRKGTFGSNGLAIYYPHTGFAHTNDPDGPGYEPGNQDHPVEFVQAERWQAFLHAYWKLVP